MRNCDHMDIRKMKRVLKESVFSVITEMYLAFSKKQWKETLCICQFDKYSKSVKFFFNCFNGNTYQIALNFPLLPCQPHANEVRVESRLREYCRTSNNAVEVQ